MPGQIYRQLGVQLWGRGAYEREELEGSQTKYKSLSRVEAGDIVVNKIWARNGSVAVVPPDLAGCYVSGEFPSFSASLDKLDPAWFHWYTKTPALWSQCDEKSRGTSGKNRIRPEKFLEIEIPLPPIDEQRRIVSRIEELAAKVSQTRTLRASAQQETSAILDSAINDIWEDRAKWQKKPIRMLATPVSGQVDPRIEPFTNLPHINGECIESGTCRLLEYRLAREDGVTSGKFHFNSGAILYSKIRPYLRKAVQVPVEGICSADVYAFETFSPEVTPRFFMYSLVAPPFTTYANSLSGRTRMPKLNQNQLFAFEMSFPPLAEQHRIVAYLDNLQAKTQTLKKLQSETAAELDALMPSILSRAFRGEL
jgi:type I restriction enzyme, S subunit